MVAVLTDGSASGLALEKALQADITDRIARLAASLDVHCPSDLSFSNLYLFREAHGYRFHGGTLPGLSGRTYDGQSHFFPLFDIREASAGALAGLISQHGCLYPIAGTQLCDLDPFRYRWEASPDDADYLYPVENFLHYRGPVLRKRRALMAQLLAAHDLDKKRLGPGTESAAYAVLDAWMSEKGKQEGQADQRSCREAIDYADAFRLEGWIYFADGKPAGFLIVEHLQPRVCVVRFAKGSAEFVGIYQYMFHDLAHTLFGKVDWLNFEQDMGAINFRRSKMSYQPAAMIPKYRVFQRQRVPTSAPA